MRNTRRDTSHLLTGKHSNCSLSLSHDNCISRVEEHARDKGSLCGRNLPRMLPSEGMSIVNCNDSFDSSINVGVQLRCKEDSLRLSAVKDDGNEDDLSMLLSLQRNHAQDHTLVLWKRPLREHEYDDDSCDECSIKDGHRFTQPSLETESSPRTTLPNDRLHTTHIHLKSDARELHNSNEKLCDGIVDNCDGIMRLVFDCDFDCYFDPASGQYYKVMPRNKTNP